MKPAPDIITFSENLKGRIKERLDQLNNNHDDLLKLGETLSFIRDTLEELKVFTSSYKFINEPEEIRFFKEAKPALLSQYFYCKKIFAIRLFDSFKDVGARQANYYRLLERLEKFVRKNKEFYEYCMTRNTCLDKHYFTRHKSYKSLDKDEYFTTHYDTRLAKFLANESVKNYILASLLKTSAENTERGTLTWTGPKASLVELIYALHSVEAFNKGSADIKLLATTFEKQFNVSLGNYYRVLQDIRIRKSSQTTFLDQLKDKLQRRLDQYDQ